MDVTQPIWIAPVYFLNEWSADKLDPLQINRSAHCWLFLVNKVKEIGVIFSARYCLNDLFCEYSRGHIVCCLSCFPLF